MQKRLFMKPIFKNIFLSAVLMAGLSTQVVAQESPLEEDFFKILKVSSPEGILLEVGGLTVLPNRETWSIPAQKAYHRQVN